LSYANNLGDYYLYLYFSGTTSYTHTSPSSGSAGYTLSSPSGGATGYTQPSPSGGATGYAQHHSPASCQEGGGGGRRDEPGQEAAGPPTSQLTCQTSQLTSQPTGREQTEPVDFSSSQPPPFGTACFAAPRCPPTSSNAAAAALTAVSAGDTLARYRSHSGEFHNLTSTSFK
jgi:hypothetical protein